MNDSTTFTISANINGKDNNLEFVVPKKVTPEEWTQLSRLFKLAMEQLGK